MKNKFKLRLYHSNECNLDCYFCTSKKNNSIEHLHIANFISENIDFIDNDSIEVSGGEPTINISSDMMLFLSNNFNSVVLNSNMTKDIEPLKRYDNVRVIASFNGINDRTRDANKCFNNIVKNKEIIQNVNYVITKETISDMYDTCKILYKNDIEVLFLFQESNDETIDFDKLSEQLDLISKSNYHTIVRNLNRKKEYNCESCYSRNIVINGKGHIYKCIRESDVYRTPSEKYNHTIYDKDVFKKLLSEKKSKTRCEIMNSTCSATEISENSKFEEVFDYYRNNKLKYELDIRSITLFMTEQCNMACTYCFEKNAKKNKNLTDNNIIKKVIDIAMEDESGKNVDILLFGGEPSINISGIEYAIDYYEAIKSNKKNRISFQINTNMYTMNDRIIEVYDKIARVSSFGMTVSVDGFKDNHDMNRIDHDGKGTYDRVMSNLKTLKSKRKQKYKILKHTVLNRDSINFIEKIGEQMLDDRALFCEQSITFMSSDKNVVDDFTSEDFEKAYYLIQSLLKKYLNKKEEYNALKEYFSGLLLDPDFLLHNTDMIIGMCDAGDKMISVRSNGDILPCHAYLDLSPEELKDVTFEHNIMSIESNKIIIDKNSKLYRYYGKNKKIENKEYTMKSELGYDCSQCKISCLCHACLANGLLFDEHNVITRTKGRCNRTMNMADIMVKIKQMQIENDKINFLKSQEEMLKNVLNGVMMVSEVALNNRQHIEQIEKDIYGGNE